MVFSVDELMQTAVDRSGSVDLGDIPFEEPLGILIASVMGRTSAVSEWACWALAAGVLIFSGSLYLLAVTGTRMLGAITPIGGLCFIAGWLLLAWHFISTGGKS